MTVGRKEGHVQIYRLTAAVTDEHCTNPLVSPTYSYYMHCSQQ